MDCYNDLLSLFSVCLCFVNYGVEWWSNDIVYSGIYFNDIVIGCVIKIVVCYGDKCVVSLGIIVWWYGCYVWF